MTYETTPGGASLVEDRARKPYEATPDGGFRVRTERRIGEVRVPNYVYDLWLPVLGMDAVALYSVYCRMERNDTIRGMNQKTLAGLCRIGTDKLNKLNTDLEEWGFIRIERPTGAARLAHHCTTVVVLDPPKEVPAQAIVALCPDGELKHGTLKDWLIDPVPVPVTAPPENGFRDAGAEIQECVEDGSRNATLGNPLSGNPSSLATAEPTNGGNRLASWGDGPTTPRWRPYRDALFDYFGRLETQREWEAVLDNLEQWDRIGRTPGPMTFADCCVKSKEEVYSRDGKMPRTIIPLVGFIVDLQQRERAP